MAILSIYVTRHIRTNLLSILTVIMMENVLENIKKVKGKVNFVFIISSDGIILIFNDEVQRYVLM